ncbi:MAG: glycosyltransferase family 1 protein, partial [Deltaproteobacteria bacterium]
QEGDQGIAAMQNRTASSLMDVGIVSIWHERGISFQALQLARTLDAEGFRTHILSRWESSRFSNAGAIHHPRVTNGGDDPAPSDVLSWVRANDIRLVIFMEVHPRDWKRVEHLKKNGVRVACYENLDILRKEHLSDYGLIDWFLCHTFYSSEVFRKICPDSRILFVPWGIPSGVCRPSGRGGDTTDEVRFLHVGGWGGINNRKNTDMVIRAFHEGGSGNSRLLLYSQVPIEKYGRECEKIVSSDKRIELYEGTVDDIFSAYGEADVLLWPSKREGLGLPVVEALASGVPVVISDGYMMKQWPVAGEHGVVCPATPRHGQMYLPEMDVDFDALIRLIRSLSEDPDKVRKLRTNVARDRRVWLWNWQGRVLCEMLKSVIEDGDYEPPEYHTYLPRYVLEHEKKRRASMNED